MKKTFFVMAIAMFISIGIIKAQAFKMSVDAGSKISFTEFSSDIDIEGTDGKELLITCSKRPVKTERSKGLSAVYANGEDNTNIGLSVNKNGNTIEVVSLSNSDKFGTYKIKVPNGVSIFAEKRCSSEGTIIIQSFKGEIEAKACNGMTLKDITGPIVLSNIGGLIEIVFKSVSQTSPMSITSVGGEIDVTVPEKAAANIEVKTGSGEFFTDFDAKSLNKEKKQHHSGNGFQSTLNGGGVDFKFSTVGGSIYLRKAK